MDERRNCKRCLIREMADGEEIFRNLYEYIENLDEEVKASAEVYDERLSLCKQCDSLLSGMCRHCGCYVEMRAVIDKNYCPVKKW
jgi:Rieske Fe-S protein